MVIRVAWIRKARPRPGEAVFHRRRMDTEGFRKPYLRPTPVYRFIRAVYTVPVRLEDFYYMGLGELTEYIVAATRDLAEERGEGAVVEIAAAARRQGLVKDPPLVVAEVLGHRNGVAEILSLDYPVTKILLYAEIARKGDTFTWGRKKKTAIAETLAGKTLHWHELQAVKYRAKYRRLLRLVHPKPFSKELEAIWGWIAKRRREPPTPFIEAYKRVAVLAEKGSLEAAVGEAIDAGLPWEVVRSRIGRYDRIRDSLLAEAAAKIMTGNDIALQARTLAERLGERKVAEIARVKPVSVEAASRAAINLSPAYPGLAAVFAEKAMVPPERIYREILGGWRPRRTVALIDVSGSMDGNGIERAARLYLSLSSIIDETYLFNYVYNPPKRVDVPRDTRGLLDWLTRLQGEPCAGTPLYDAVRTVGSSLGEDDLLIVFTDEQENVSQSRLENILDIAGKTNILLAIVVGYPTPMLPPVAVRHGVAGAAVGHSYEAFAASARALAIEKQLVEGVVDPDEVYSLFSTR